MKYIIGNCALEGGGRAHHIAAGLKEVQDELREAGYDVEIIFKGSYSKPVRGSRRAYRGMGIRDGLAVLASIKNEYGLKVTSDVHSLEEIKLAKDVLDIIQIPQHMSKHSYLIEAAAETGKQVSIKKGLALDTETMALAVDKVKSKDNPHPVILIERGNAFGYSTPVVDMLNIKRFNDIGGVISCIDASHPAGNRENIATLASAGVAAGAGMVFIETHPKPETALCDGATSLEFRKWKFYNLIKTLEDIHAAVKRNKTSVPLF